MFRRSSSAVAGATPGLFVIHRSDAAVAEGGRRRLAEIVAHRAEHDGDLLGMRQVVDPRPRLVDHHQRVDPDVPFGMPLRLLRAADRAPAAPGTAARRRPARAPAAGRPTAARREEQQLLDLAPDPLRRQVVERQAAAHLLASRRPCSSSKRAANCRPRSTRRLSSPNVARVDHAQATRDRESARPSNGSRYSPVSGSQAIALTVKSRRRAASSGAHATDRR